MFDLCWLLMLSVTTPAHPNGKPIQRAEERMYSVQQQHKSRLQKHSGLSCFFIYSVCMTFILDSITYHKQSFVCAVALSIHITTYGTNLWQTHNR